MSKRNADQIIEAPEPKKLSGSSPTNAMESDEVSKATQSHNTHEALEQGLEHQHPVEQEVPRASPMSENSGSTQAGSGESTASAVLYESHVYPASMLDRVLTAHVNINNTGTDSNTTSSIPVYAVMTDKENYFTTRPALVSLHYSPQLANLAALHEFKTMMGITTKDSVEALRLDEEDVWKVDPVFKELTEIKTKNPVFHQYHFLNFGEVGWGLDEDGCVSVSVSLTADETKDVWAGVYVVKMALEDK